VLYPLLVIGLFSPYPVDHPGVFYASIVTFLFVAVVRLLLTKTIQNHGSTPGWRRTAFRWGVTIGASAWGGFSAVTLIFYPDEWTGMIVLLMSAGPALVTLRRHRIFFLPTVSCSVLLLDRRPSCSVARKGIRWG
jgi:hypothetical protein